MVILLTGSTGFLGKHILEAYKNDHSIDTLNRYQSDYNVDLSNTKPVFPKNYDVVIHCAGKAHFVPTNDNQNNIFNEVNVVGTKNLIKGLDDLNAKPKSFIFISSVAVYGANCGEGISENFPLVATDSYGKSKVLCEQLIQCWCDENNVICSILRLPLIAGPNPPGNLKAMIAGIRKNYYFNINGGKARKSIVLASDVAKILFRVSLIGGIYNLTDGDHPSFSELSSCIALQLNKSQPLDIPFWLANIIAKIGDHVGAKSPLNTAKLIKITSHLTFDDTKAREVLQWSPTKVLNGFKIK